MTGGMDNPVDVVFTPGGERIFTTTFFQHPGGGQRDGLIHAVYGGIYGKDHDVDLRATRGPGPTLMPVLVAPGPRRPVRPDTATSRPPSARSTRTTSSPASSTCTRSRRHVLDARRGDVHDRRTRTSSSSDNLDFHPTDVLEDADGSLLVVDTGGWYKLCCPTSQLQKPDVLGGDLPRPPQGCAAGRRPARAEARLDDDDAATSSRACSTTRGRPCGSGPSRPWPRRGEAAVAALRPGAASADRSPEARRNAVWAATRIDRSARRGWSSRCPRRSRRDASARRRSIRRACGATARPSPR